MEWCVVVVPDLHVQVCLQVCTDSMCSIVVDQIWLQLDFPITIHTELRLWPVIAHHRPDDTYHNVVRHHHGVTSYTYSSCRNYGECDWTYHRLVPCGKKIIATGAIHLALKISDCEWLYCLVVSLQFDQRSRVDKPSYFSIAALTALVGTYTCTGVAVDVDSARVAVASNIDKASPYYFETWSRSSITPLLLPYRNILYLLVIWIVL
jgi:hypothetical protein